MDKYYVIAKIFNTYLGYQMGPRLKRLRLLLRVNDVEQLEFYGDHRIDLENYYNALIEFKDYWYKKGVGNKDPWQHFFCFMECPGHHLSEVIYNACPSVKRHYKGRLKAPGNKLKDWKLIQKEFIELDNEQGERNEEDDYDKWPTDFF